MASFGAEQADLGAEDVVSILENLRKDGLPGIHGHGQSRAL
jgi:hypothetical protein